MKRKRDTWDKRDSQRVKSCKIVMKQGAVLPVNNTVQYRLQRSAMTSFSLSTVFHDLQTTSNNVLITVGENWIHPSQIKTQQCVFSISDSCCRSNS